jgi:hypothetical protein
METDTTVDTFIICIVHLSFTDNYSNVLVFFMNLSARIRHKLSKTLDLVPNRPLRERFKWLCAYKGHIPILFRAKFYPFDSFRDYVENRLEEKDFSTIKLFYTGKKKDITGYIPEFNICFSCGRKGFFTTPLKGFLCEDPKIPCDLERVSKPAPTPSATPKRRFVDVAVGPDDARFNSGWEVKQKAKRIKTTQPTEPQIELTDEEKQQLMIDTLRKKEEPPPPNYTTLMWNALRLAGNLRQFNH